MLQIIAFDSGETRWYGVYVIDGDGPNQHRFTGYAADRFERAEHLLVAVRALDLLNT